jgi:Fe2+ transport system protein FeoA
MTLNDLKTHDRAVIAGVTNERLQQMGIVPTRTVTVLRRGACCLHIRVGSTEWAIRDQDARSVEIIPREPPGVAADC